MRAFGAEPTLAHASTPLAALAESHEQRRHLDAGLRSLVALVGGPGCARSSASSAELVVSTPNAIGTPVAAAAAVSPFDTACAM